MDLLKCYECSNTVIKPYPWLEIMRNHDLIVWLRWVNKNICQQISTDNWTTTDVKVRIATGMLFKMKSVLDYQKIVIHTYFVANIRQARIDYELSTLPF